MCTHKKVETARTASKLTPETTQDHDRSTACEWLVIHNWIMRYRSSEILYFIIFIFLLHCNALILILNMLSNCCFIVSFIDDGVGHLYHFSKSINDKVPIKHFVSSHYPLIQEFFHVFDELIYPHHLFTSDRL